jgi:hypothetical protein
MRRSAAEGIMIVAVLLAAPPATCALADDSNDPPIVVVPGNQDQRGTAPHVDVDVHSDGAAGDDGTATSGGTPQRGPSACRWVAVPEMEAWIRRLPAALPAAGVDRIDRRVRLYQRRCGGLDSGYAWLGAGQSAAATLPDPAMLAREAYAQLRLPLPAPAYSPDLQLPDGRRAVLVGEQTWMWTAGSGFTARSRLVRAGTVWARVTATPVGLSVDPGDGSPVVSCPGPGTAFVAGRYPQHAASPSCGHVYQQSSAGQPGGVVTAQYGIRWRVRWAGSTGAAATGGALPDMTSRTAVTFAVAEAQALDTAGGG